MIYDPWLKYTNYTAYLQQEEDMEQYREGYYEGIAEAEKARKEEERKKWEQYHPDPFKHEKEDDYDYKYTLPKKDEEEPYWNRTPRSPLYYKGWLGGFLKKP